MDILAVRVDAVDPPALARFWAGLLGWTPAGDGWRVVSDDEADFDLRFVPSSEPKRGRNQAHLDLTNTSPDHQRTTIVRALVLGAEHVDVGQP